MTGGVATALGEAIEAGGTMDEVVQAGLFAELEPHETGALDAPSPLSRSIGQAGRRPGRPKGSKNRRTEDVTAWLLQQHRHPLSVMMEAYSMTPVELAHRIGIPNPDAGEILDIFKLQVRMAEAVAPYVAQKLPQAVQLDAAANLSISFGGVDLSGGVSSPARAGSPEISMGGGMAVRLGQVGRDKSDGDLED